MQYLDLSMLLLGLDPVGQLSSLSDQLIGFAGLAQPLSALLAQVEDVGVQLLDLCLTCSNGAAIDELLLRSR